MSVGILDEPFTYVLDDTTAVEVYDGEMLAVGCLLPDDCQGEPPEISTRPKHTTESTNVVVSYQGATTVSKEELLSMRLLVSVTVREHRMVNMNYKVKCSAASSVPSANIPVPYTKDTAVYSLRGHYNLTHTISNEFLDGVNAWTSRASIMCQEAVASPELTSEVWVPLLISTPFRIIFFQGAPLFSSLNLGPEIVYKYFDNATGGIWDVQLNYTTTGNFTLTGNASNALSRVGYSSLVHVVPVVTDEWVVTALCPCLSVSEGFNFSLDLAAAPNPPFTALVYATLNNGVLLLNKSLDFGTSSGGGASQALRSTFSVTVLEPGNYSVTFVLTNEVSSTTIATQEGEYQVVVSGYNSVQGWINSDPFLVVVLEKLQGFELDDDGAVVEPTF
ncbi:uncharacterized protein [Panulirus ornatus]|uniref:uncharacterized protein n=1 Tax=Panulirus ornatus TaxID=150431 RepID=UPI003A8AED9D